MGPVESLGPVFCLLRLRGREEAIQAADPHIGRCQGETRVRQGEEQGDPALPLLPLPRQGGGGDHHPVRRALPRRGQEAARGVRGSSARGRRPGLPDSQAGQDPHRGLQLRRSGTGRLLLGGDGGCSRVKEECRVAAPIRGQVL